MSRQAHIDLPDGRQLDYEIRFSGKARSLRLKIRIGEPAEAAKTCNSIGYLYYLFGILGIEVSGEQTYPALWCRLAFTREGLDSAVPGQFLTIPQGGEPVLIRNDQVMTFWRRISCPPGTPVQFRRDIKWRVWGIELPIAPPFG